MPDTVRLVANPTRRRRNPQDVKALGQTIVMPRLAEAGGALGGAVVAALLPTLVSRVAGRFLAKLGVKGAGLATVAVAWAGDGAIVALLRKQRKLSSMAMPYLFTSSAVHVLQVGHVLTDGKFGLNPMQQFAALPMGSPAPTPGSVTGIAPGIADNRAVARPQLPAVGAEIGAQINVQEVPRL